MRLYLSLFALVLVTLAALGGPALAQDESLNRARGHFDKGQTLYQAGEYGKAAEEFQAAYQARSFPQFLFNTAACFEKAQKYEKAVEYYQRYLSENEKAEDREKVEKRIAVLEKEIERLASETPPDETDPEKPEEPETAEEPSEAVQELGDVKIRGLVVIESEPANAFIYLDDKKGEPLSRTPWNGTIEGNHTLFIVREGYKPIEKRISPSPDKLLVLYFSLAEEDYLGWVKITSNVAGADVYIDDRESGVVGQTPWQDNLEPGKHKVWVTKAGYDEFSTEIEITRGETHKIQAKLEGSPVGYLNFRGDVDQASIYVDGELLCEGACRKPVPGGAHKLTVKQSGYKPYTRKVDLQAQTELTIRPRLAEEPSRTDAIFAYVFSGVFFGAGIWAGLEAQSIRDDLQTDIENGMPPPSPDDSRFNESLFYAIGADAAFAIGSVSLLTAIYYTFRDKGPPSTGTTDIKSLAAEPKVGPNYVGMEVSW